MENFHRDDEEIVHLVNIKDLVQMTMTEDALKAAGIEYVVKPHETMAYDGLFTLGKGFGDIYVFKSDLEKAQKVLGEMEETGTDEEE